MKLLVTILLSACTCVALAQQKTRQSLHQDIDDDGKTLSINISGTSGGKTINYNRQFNVAGMSKAAKDAILNHITDSLGLKQADHPPAPPAPLKQQVSVNSSVHSSIKEHNDILTIQINGTKNNTPLNYNQTFNVKGMNKQQKDGIVRRVTDSLGIGGN